MTSTRPCRGCSAPISGPRIRYCPECRASPCRACHRQDGTHSLTCRVGAPPFRPCRRCGALIPAVRGTFYCPPCQATACPECRRKGPHRASCQYEQRQHRPAPVISDDPPTDDDFLLLLLGYGRRAQLIARTYGPPAEAADIVQDVMEAMVRRRAYLHGDNLPGYFLTAVHHTALRRWRYARMKRLVLVDGPGLLLAEIEQRRLELGRRTYANERPNTLTPRESWAGEPVG